MFFVISRVIFPSHPSSYVSRRRISIICYHGGPSQSPQTTIHTPEITRYYLATSIVASKGVPPSVSPSVRPSVGPSRVFSMSRLWLKMDGNDWENSCIAQNSSKSIPSCLKMSENVSKCPSQTHRCLNRLVLSQPTSYVSKRRISIICDHGGPPSDFATSIMAVMAIIATSIMADIVWDLNMMISR